MQGICTVPRRHMRRTAPAGRASTSQEEEALRRVTGKPLPTPPSGEVAAAVVEHLETLRPGDAMTDSARLTATAGLASRRFGTFSNKATTAARGALGMLPQVPPNITRGEYAVVARKALWAYDLSGSEPPSTACSDYGTRDGVSRTGGDVEP